MVAGLSVDRSAAGWWLLGAFLFVVLAYVLTAFIGPIVFAVFVYYASRPVYRRLLAWTGYPTLAAALALLVLVLPALAIMTAVIAVALVEFERFARGTDLAEYSERIELYLDFTEAIEQVSELVRTGGLEGIGVGLDVVMGSLGLMLSVIINLFIMIAVAFYLLRDDQRLSLWARGTFGDENGVFDSYLDAIDRDFTAIFFGNILNAAITGTIGAVIFSGLNLLAPPGAEIPYPVLIGFLTGVTSLIPIVGMKLVYVPVTLYLLGAAFVTGGSALLWFPILFFVVTLFLVDIIPDLLLRPYLSGRQLHIGAVMLAYVFGPLLFGWYGLFLGPILLVLIFHFARIVLPILTGGLTMRPYAVDPPYLPIDTVADSSDASSEERTETVSYRRIEPVDDDRIDSTMPVDRASVERESRTDKVPPSSGDGSEGVSGSRTVDDPND